MGYVLPLATRSLFLLTGDATLGFASSLAGQRPFGHLVAGGWRLSLGLRRPTGHPPAIGSGRAARLVWSASHEWPPLPISTTAAARPAVLVVAPPFSGALRRASHCPPSSSCPHHHGAASSVFVFRGSHVSLLFRSWRRVGSSGRWLVTGKLSAIIAGLSTMNLRLSH